MHQHWHTRASSAEARAFMRLSIHRTQHPVLRQLHSYSGGRNMWKHGRTSRTCTGSPRPCRRRCLLTEAKAQRAVVLLPGLGNSFKDYQAVGEALESRGLHVQCAAVTRLDWLRNAAGLRQIEYWTGKLEPRPTVDWYLNKVDAAVTAAKLATDGPITILAHSAGGWLSRVYLLGFGVEQIDRLVTLGSPHQAPPKDLNLVDQTRGILTWVTDNVPGNFHQEIGYATIAGKWMKGARLRGSGGSLTQKLVGLGYQQVCGDPEVWGDGITPVPAAHLEGKLPAYYLMLLRNPASHTGAEQITLDGVYHSPLGGGVSRPWYGSPEVLDRWIRVVYDGKELDTDFQVELGDMVAPKK